jgi:hypothetical protein
MQTGYNSNCLIGPIQGSLLNQIGLKILGLEYFPPFQTGGIIMFSLDGYTFHPLRVTPFGLGVI